MLFEVFIQNIEPLNIAGYHRGCSAKKPPLANRKLLHFSPWLRNMMREEKYYSECAMCNYYTALTIYYIRSEEEIVLSRHTDYVSRPLPRKLNKLETEERILQNNINA